MHYLVTGGSGFIGRQLCASLVAGQNHVTVLTRDRNGVRAVLPPDVDLIEDLDALRNTPIDAVINLAGASLNDRADGGGVPPGRRGSGNSNSTGMAAVRREDEGQAAFGPDPNSSVARDREARDREVVTRPR